MFIFLCFINVSFSVVFVNILFPGFTLICIIVKLHVSKLDLAVWYDLVYKYCCPIFSIRITCPCNLYPLTPHFHIEKKNWLLHVYSIFCYFGSVT